jgi:hypothetical protein
MAVHTFSTKDKNVQETEAVQRVKQHCIANKLNFSAVVVSLIVEWEKANVKPRN